MPKRKSHKKKKPNLLERALEGDVKAMYSLGEKIYNERNSEWHDPNDPKVFAEAFMWFTLAAEGGDLRAIEKLGFMYATGQGVDKNFSKGINLLKEAEEKGSKDAGGLAQVLQNISKKFDDKK